MTVTNREPYQQAYYPPAPTGFICYMRRFLPWQFLRFIVLNWKIMKLLGNSQPRPWTGAGPNQGSDAWRSAARRPSFSLNRPARTAANGE